MIIQIYRMTWIHLFWIFSLISTCDQSGNTSSVSEITYSFPSVENAQRIICTDQKEHYFDRVQQLDMKIQMKDDSDQPITMSAYLDFLKSDITQFTKSEQKRIEKLLYECNSAFSNLGLNIDIDEIQIIKTKGQTYGPQAFFTREKAIMIPDGQLEMSDRGLKSVLLHEIFHILSRYNPEIKKAAYALIGFLPLEHTYTIADQKLRKRVLLNPDGLSNDFGIALKSKNGETMMAVPLIHSKHKNFKTSVSSYFDYINFEVYRLDRASNQMMSKSDFSNDVPDEFFNNFFEQIADNTQYIIHPDEIMADNFMLMINAFEENKFDHFSESGKTIIYKLREILTIN